jgi:hypothetical protein
LETGDEGTLVIASWSQAAAAHARGDLHGSVWADLKETSHLPQLAVRVFDGHLCITQRFLYGSRPYADVISFANALATEAQRLGAARGHAFAVTLRGEAWLLSGQLDAAEQDLVAGGRMHRAIGGATGEALSLQRRSELAIYRGQMDRARGLLDPSTRKRTRRTPCHSSASSRKAMQHARRQRLGVAEPDAVDRLPLVPQLQRQVLLAHQPLRHHLHLLAEGRRREALAPHLLVQRVDQVGGGTRARAGRRCAAGAAAWRRPAIPAPPAPAPARTRRGALATVQPAAIAWPPKRSSTPGWRLATRSSASRRWKPGIERPEPLSSCSLPGAWLAANTKVGPVEAVLDARGDDADHAFVEVGVEHAERRRRLLAFLEQRLGHLQRLSRISPSMSRRSRLMPSSVRASSSARAMSSVSRHSMPSVMSASRPAALMRGPSAKPKSKVVATSVLRPAAVNSAASPQGRRRRGCASGPAPPGGGCWHRA